VNRWLAVLSPVTTFGVLSGHGLRDASPIAGEVGPKVREGRSAATRRVLGAVRRQDHDSPPARQNTVDLPLTGGSDSAQAARRLIGMNRWETEWAANGGDLLRILKAL
jgi:hypothetical protein